MFWSKIWLFLVTLAGAIALTIALVLPRPAERQQVDDEHQRMAVACGVIDILLADDARNRVELTGVFARAPEIVSALEAASSADKLDEARMRQVREVGDKVMTSITGNRKPDFAMLVDRRGRVVARVRLDEDRFPEVVAGRPLVDDALAGYMRDDLWAQNGTMYFVAAAPVIKRDPPVAYVGAVVLGHKITNEFAKRLTSSLNVEVGFHLGKDDVAGSSTLSFDHAPLLAAVGGLTGPDLNHDCQATTPIPVTANSEDFTAVVARLPGEASLKQAYYSVLIQRPQALGFSGTLHAVQKSDLSFGNFPWILVGGLFVGMLALGIGLTWFEADRPLRRLTGDAVRLAKGDSERLSEDAHGGKFGSIARSVNIHIDKLGREAKGAKKDLDQLLGPAPEGSLGTIDLLATALPQVRPGGPGPSAPPPPSEFKFADPLPPPSPPPSSPSMLSAPPPAPPRAPPGRAATPPIDTPQRSAPPAVQAPTGPMARAPAAPAAAAPIAPPLAAAPPPAIDEDILAPTDPPTIVGPTVDPYFKQVFDQFVSVKKSCNESTSGLTYQKFSEKLVKNRDDLMAKTGCKEVRFTVYVKDGKAALKATPVKDDAV